MIGSPSAACVTARVALPLPLRKTFSYRIPPHLAGACRVGVRVAVPFGRKRAIGLVVALEPEEYGRPGLRTVEEALDPAPALDADLLRFTHWLADYYVAPWGQVIQAALPGALRARTLRRLELTESGQAVLEDPFSGIHPAARQVLVLLARRGPLPEDRLKKLLPRSGTSLRRDLAARGWIHLVEELRPPARRSPQVEWVEIADRPGSPSGLFRGRAQRAILEALATGGPMRTADLLHRSGGSRSSLRALVRRGVVRLKLLTREDPAGAGTPGNDVPRPDLTAAQQKAVEALVDSIERREFQTFLLEGVTGSGKTEVYLRAAEAALERGEGVLYLVPEIGLTPLLATRLSERFCGRVAVLHSGLSEGERYRQWTRIRDGRASLILGTRSALFAPHPRIGLVVVDEEQDPSYFQSESPRYNARDAVLVRAQRLGATAVLGSATPSLEAMSAARSGKFRRLSLPERVEKRPLPSVRLIDMKDEFRATGVQGLLSRELIAAIREVRATGEQALLLLNRRGFSTFLLCRACGAVASCVSCSIALTYHRVDEKLRCHYCSFQRPLPRLCPGCRSPHLHLGGAGTQRLEEAIRIVDPELRVGRMDRDSVKGRGHAVLLRRFERKEIDLLLGTQMIAKGHDFPGVTLVGVVSADALLALPDFRAAERTYQMIAQVAGRAGRGDRPGRVLVQAFSPEHPALQAAATHDPSRFYDRELRLRRLLGYPPFTALIQLRIEDRNPGRGWRDARRVADRLRAAGRGEYEVLGPSPAPRTRLKGRYRFQILLKGKGRAALGRGVRATLDSLEDSGEMPSQLVVEVDPRSLL